MTDDAVIDRLEELRSQFASDSDEYADISMTVQYLEDPDYFEVDIEDAHTRTLGTIGETEVSVRAEGPKAQWCADVLSDSFAGLFDILRQQAEVNDD
jgi:hypothetical protein